MLILGQLKIFDVFYHVYNILYRVDSKWRTQNVKKATHIKGRLLNQGVILFNRLLFKMGTYLKGKYLLTEEANSFL